ncbi:hypothetical protein [Nocardia farcinica]|uniref:hypothetical protein n=1 Tax=Nocardia farcinica TaxID=37329 RepID=UPI0024543155|nr:hypothetical protein [Nocardia farcinica]
MKIPKKPSRPPRHPAVIDTTGAGPRPTPSTAVATKTPAPARTLPIKKLAAGAALLAVAAAAALLRPDEPTTGDSVPTAAPPATTSEPAAASSAPAGGCRAERGDQNSGEGVIRAFEYAYYVTRSAAEARSLAAPTSSVMPADALQPVIDAVPPGTTYCLQLTPIGANAYVTVLSEIRPGQQPQRWTQTVTTTQIDGRWYVDQFQ